jgi:hypothetical protein
MEELSTQAADLLGVSRQFFVRECEAHELAFDYTGAPPARPFARLQEAA